MSQKFFFVPWQGYTEGCQPEERGMNDLLCLQGPHTLERAQEVAREVRGAGFMASVIDCSESLKYSEIAPDMLNALKLAQKMMINLMAKGNVNWGNTFCIDFGLMNEVLIAIDSSISKAEKL